MDNQLPKPTHAAKESFATEIASELFRSHVKQIIRIHHVMFERLLCENGNLPPGLAALLEDAGAAYLRLAKIINEKESSALL